MSLGTRLGRDPQESEEGGWGGGRKTLRRVRRGRKTSGECGKGDPKRVEGGGRKTLGGILPHHGIHYSQQCARKVVAIFIFQQQEFTCTGNIMEWNWSSVPTDSEEARQIDDYFFCPLSSGSYYFR